MVKDFKKFLLSGKHKKTKVTRETSPPPLLLSGVCIDMYSDQPRVWRCKVQLWTLFILWCRKPQQLTFVSKPLQRPSVWHPQPLIQTRSAHSRYLPFVCTELEILVYIAAPQRSWATSCHHFPTNYFKYSIRCGFIGDSSLRVWLFDRQILFVSGTWGKSRRKWSLPTALDLRNGTPKGGRESATETTIVTRTEKGNEEYEKTVPAIPRHMTALVSSYPQELTNSPSLEGDIVRLSGSTWFTLWRYVRLTTALDNLKTCKR